MKLPFLRVTNIALRSVSVLIGSTDRGVLKYGEGSTGLVKPEMTKKLAVSLASLKSRLAGAKFVNTKNSRGDTIIEVLVSMTILALVLGAAYATANRSLRTGADAGIRSQAVSYAQQQVEILKSIALNTPERIGDYKFARPFCVSPITTELLRLDKDLDGDGNGDVCALPIGSPNEAEPAYVVIKYIDSLKTFEVTSQWPSSNSEEDSKITLHYRPQGSLSDLDAAIPPCPACSDDGPIVPTGPYVELTASPTAVNVGGSTTLTWITGMVDSCRADPNIPGMGGWNGNKDKDGGTVPNQGPINSDTTFRIVCQRSGFPPVESSVTVSVQRITRFEPDNPTVASGSGTMLRWTTTSNITSCSLGSAPTGQRSTGNLYSTTDYSLICSGPAGNTPPSTTRVTVTGGSPGGTPPTIILYNTAGTETTIYTDRGVSRQLRWLATGPGTNCYIEGIGWVGQFGVRTITAYPSRNYELECSNPSGWVSRDFTFSYINSFVNLYQNAGSDADWPGWTKDYDDGTHNGTGDVSSLRVVGRASLRDSDSCYTFTPGATSTFYSWVENYGIKNDSNPELVVGKGCNGQ